MSQDIFNPRDEFTKSVATLREMLERCMESLGRYENDKNEPEILKTALQIIKEINRLFRLYSEEFKRQESVSAEAEELEHIRNYLEPLELTTKIDMPTLELVRLATYKIRELTDAENNSSVPKNETGRGKAKPRKVARRS